MAIRDETLVRTAWAYSKSTEDLASTTTATTNNNPPFNNKHPTPYKHHHRFAQQQARNTPTVLAQGGGGTQASGHQQPEYENLLEVRPLQKPSAAALMNESKRKFTRQADWRQLKRFNATEYKDRLVP